MPKSQRGPEAQPLKRQKVRLETTLDRCSSYKGGDQLSREWGWLEIYGNHHVPTCLALDQQPRPRPQHSCEFLKAL